MTSIRHTLAHCVGPWLLLGATACAAEDPIWDGPTSSVTQAELDGSKFLLERSEGFQPVADTEVELRFTDGSLNLYADCNDQWWSRYEIQDSTLLLSGFGMNQIGCRPEQRVQDEWLAKFFSSRPRIGRNGDRVILTGTSAKLSFLANPDLPLVGAAWSVAELIVDERPSTATESEDASIAFRPDGTLQVDTSCSSGRGDYLASSNRITLSNVTYSERACTGPRSLADEHVKSVLANGVLGFAIDGRRLTLRREKLGLLATREVSE